MKLSIIEMNEKEYKNFSEFSFNDYIQTRMKVDRTSYEKAFKFCRDQTNSLLKDGFRTKDHFFYKLVVEDQAGGHLWCHLNRYTNSIFIYDLHVFEEWRGRGIGKSAIDFVKKLATEYHANSVSLNVFSYNSTAEKLYQKEGFKTVSQFMEYDLDE